MSEPQGYAPSWCAEFPNDNPALHDGASWICLSVGGPLRPVTRARPGHAPRPVADTPRRAPESDVPAAETFPPAEALLASETASEADDSVEAPGLADAVGLEETLPVGSADAPSCETPSEPLELDAIDAPAQEPPTPLELEGIDAPLSPESCGEPLELDAIARPGADGITDAVFDFDSDASDAAAAPTAEGDVGSPVSPSATMTAHGANPAETDRDAGTANAGDAARADASSSAFGAYVAALIDVALAAGHTRAAAMLPRLVDGSGFDGAELPDEMERGLVAADVLVRHGDVLAASESFTAVSTAWRSVLSGFTNDLAVCGDSTLDGWSADLLRAFGIGQVGATDVRRELRRRGVAAFGMLQAA